jgi:malonate transporter and related proteins
VTKILADALVPIFAGLVLGYIAGLRGAMDNKNVQTLITFVMSFAIPSSMFLSIVTTSRAALREQVPTALVLLIAYAVLYAGSYFWARYGANLGASDSSVVALTIAFPNSAAVELTLLASVFGSRSAVAVVTSIVIGSISVSPITLAILEANPDSSGGGFSLKRFATSVADSFKRSIVWAPLLGLAVSLAGLNLPSFVDRS